jgi:hypothetical protein
LLSHGEFQRKGGACEKGRHAAYLAAVEAAFKERLDLFFVHGSENSWA